MRLYSYVVKTDKGFAPNPFGSYCTLACCKPKIRKNANVGDWVIGTGSKNTVGQDKLVYAMKVTEKINFDQYFQDRRFNDRADNIYYKENGNWEQKENPYHKKEDMIRDLSGICVLISNHYFYFGRNAISIPNRFNELIKKGPSYKCNFDEKLVNNFLKWLEFNYDKGRHGEPYDCKERMMFEKR